MNSQGLHARPAALFVQIASKYDSSLMVSKGSETINGKSIMGILMLGAQQYSVVTLRADGDDAEGIADAETDLPSLFTQEVVVVGAHRGQISMVRG